MNLLSRVANILSRLTNLQNRLTSLSFGENRPVKELFI